MSRISHIVRDGILDALFVVIGFWFALGVVGWKVINPLNNTWFSGDPATGYLGWLFFRREDHLSFPLGWAAEIGYPLGEPIAYLDSMPLVALVFWPFRHILPETFQYHGIVFTMSCILQLYFGYRLTLRLTPNDRVSAILGGLLFMMAAPFAWRASGHFALANHWMILAALEFFLATRERVSKRHIVISAILCFLAGATNPYIAAMTLLLVGAAYTKPLFVQNDLRSGLNAAVVSGGGIAISAVSALGAMIVFGFIVPGDRGMYAGGGYGIYSMNLLSLLDPAVYPSLLLKMQASLEGQYEGYNYLGLGVLLLALVSFSYRPRWHCFPFAGSTFPHGA